MANRERLNSTFRKMLAEKLMELGNLALAGIVFFQLLPDEPFSGRVAILGVIAFVLCYVAAYLLTKGGDD